MSTKAVFILTFFTILGVFFLGEVEAEWAKTSLFAVKVFAAVVAMLVLRYHPKIAAGAVAILLATMVVGAWKGVGSYQSPVVQQVVPTTTSQPALEPAKPACGLEDSVYLEFSPGERVEILGPAELYFQSSGQGIYVPRPYGIPLATINVAGGFALVWDKGCPPSTVSLNGQGAYLFLEWERLVKEGWITPEQSSDS